MPNLLCRQENVAADCTTTQINYGIRADWGQVTVPFRTGRTVVHIFVLTLGFSRRGFYHA